MDLYIQQEDLLKALSTIQGIIERRSTNQYTGQCLLEVLDDGLKVMATDNENTLVSKFPAKVTRKGTMSLGAAHFFQVVKLLPTGVVHLCEEENFRLSVECGPASFRINGASTENFPALPVFDLQRTIIVDSAGLRRVIDQTVFAIPSDDNRYGLNGCHLEQLTSAGGENRIRFVATDGSRLCLSEIPYSGEFAMGRRLLVPRKALLEIRRLMGVTEGEVTMGFGDRSITVSINEYLFHTRLVDGEFPPYRKVLPTAFKRHARVERGPFNDALRRVALEAQDKASTVKMVFGDDGLWVSARSVEHGEAKHPVAVDFQGAPITMGFNVRYFLDGVSVVEARPFSLQMDEALSPCVVRPGDRDDMLFVIMPIRLE